MHLEMESSSDEVEFIKEAFGVRACCNLNSWTLVITFAKMVYCCCILGLATFALILIFTSSSADEVLSQNTLLLIVILYILFAIIFAFITCRVFVAVAELQVDVEKLQRSLILFSILKIISVAGFFPSVSHFQCKIGSALDQSLAVAFVICDTCFSLCFIIMVYLFIRNGRIRTQSSDIIVKKANQNQNQQLKQFKEKCSKSDETCPMV